MINENLLKSAVSIRREYLKISNNMSLYHNRAQEVVKILEESVSKLEEIQQSIEKNKNTSSEDSINKILNVIKDIEDEGQRLEKLVDPMNKEIEKLSKEENELYRLIKEKYTTLSDDEIINIIQIRLQKEGLI
jgi:predicted transcriptional regulator